MSKKQIWISIIGAGVVASITAAASFFVDQRVVLTAAAGFITVVVGFLSKNNA